MVEVSDPETKQVLRYLVHDKNGKAVFQRAKPSVYDESQLTARELLARAAFAEGASRAFGEKQTGPEPATAAPVREAMAQLPKGPRTDRRAEERARYQELVRAMIPDDVLEQAIATAPLKVRRKVRTRRATRARPEPAHHHPTIEEAGPLSSIPMPPY